MYSPDSDQNLVINGKDGYFYRLQNGNLNRATKYGDHQTFWYFYAKQDGVYWTTRSDELWRFHIDSNQSQKLATIPLAHYQLQDVSPSQSTYILSKTISKKREVVLLH